VNLPKIDFYKILQESKLLTSRRLDQAVTIANEQGLPLFNILIDQNFVSENVLLRLISPVLNIPFELIDRATVDPKAGSLISENFAKERQILPLFQLGEMLSVAITNPFDLRTLEEIEQITKLNISPILTVKSNLGPLLEYCYSYQAADVEKDDTSMTNLFELGIKLVEDKQVSEEEITDLTQEAPIAKLVDNILKRAVSENASDIHVEPSENVVRIRFRVDGLLKDVLSPPRKLAEPIISRLKILSNLDITETRKPQDGRVTFIINGKEIDFRVATIKTITGEKIALRILDKTGAFVSLENLGLHKEDQNKLKTLLSATSGIIIVCGPTGSGKTSTLYAALSKLNHTEKNIVTIEDPVEYQLNGINQIPVNPIIGVDFDSGLSAIVRQDPDVIMVGEIRNISTASISIQAAQTGHLVFSTLHTRNASGSITRLIDMGIEPFLINSAFLGVIGQRLVRKICPNCKRQVAPEEYTSFKESQFILQLEKISEGELTLFKGDGCKICDNTGYKGRTGIFEIMLFEEKVKNLINQKANSEKIHNEAKSQGMRTMKDDGLNKVLKGITSIDEIARVLDL
jgi:type IV pilus assembly protein PilB